MIERMISVIYVEDLERSKAFYCELLGFESSFEADWIIQLVSPDKLGAELILQPRNHDLIPDSFQQKPQGVSLAFVVEDCDEHYLKALFLNLEIVRPPKNEEYGQRRFLTVDPNGVLIDISSACEPSPEFVERYMS